MALCTHIHKRAKKMTSKIPRALQEEFNVAWMHFVQATGGIINNFNEDEIAAFRSAFESGYAAGAANEARQFLAMQQARSDEQVQH